MSLKRVISIICLTAMIIDSQPISAIANCIQVAETTTLENSNSENTSEKASEEVKSTDESTNEKSEEVKSTDESTNEKSEEALNEDTTDTVSTNQDTSTNQSVADEGVNTSLKDVNFNFSLEQKAENYLQVGFDISSSTYTSNVNKDILNEIKESKLVDDTKADILEFFIYDASDKEKLSLKLSVDDLLNDDSLKELGKLKYEIGDKVFIKLFKADITSVSINGVTGGDIGLEKEDYSDGIANLDYLQNVCFVVKDNGLSTIYNQAPVINGVSDSEIASFDDFNPLAGISVSDDHDEDLLKDLVVESKDLNENQKQYIYRVTDTWGRSTETTKVVTLKVKSEKSSSSSETTLANNSIAIKGIKFGTNSSYGDTETRFNITFNDKSRKIYVTNQDGRSMNSSIKDTYFKMILYDSEGNIKKEVSLNGDDRSNSSKLDELRYYGWAYQYGDYISLWHYEAPIKISISGNVSQKDGEEAIDFSTGLTKQLLETTRFKLTSTGLYYTENEAPTITFPEEELVVTRGEDVDLSKDIYVSDDFGISDISIGTFDSTVVGEQTVTYKVTDNWGVTTTAERKVRVILKNKIEETFIRVKSIDGNLMFTMGFDELKKQFVVTTEDTTSSINPSNNSTELTIKVFNKFNVKKREFKISGKDTVSSNSIKKLINYKYEAGDYLQITPTTPSLVTIYGEIANVPEGIDYSVGVTDLDKWANVRFKIGDEQFSYIYNQAPVISGNQDINVTRGDDIDILEGMTVSDDKDGSNIELTEDNTTVTLKSGGGIFFGTQVYEIRYTDSWGRYSSVDRNVIITPKASVEQYNIELLDDENQAVLSFAYDSINNKFRVLSYNSQYSFVNSGTENAFVLEFYNKDNNEKQKEIVLSSEDLIDNEFIEKLTNFEIQDNCYMKLWYYDSSKIKITNTDSSISDITFENEDKMKNTRFTISDSEITPIYNKAPEILGAEDVSIVYGSIFDKMQNVTVNDEETNLTVNVSGDINTDELGEQQLTYTVTDSLGRTTSKIRTVTVVPVYTVNTVKYYNDENQEMFSIGINKSATGFTVNLPETMPTGSHSSTFNFKVFNANEEQIYALTINANTNINEELFNELKGLIIRPDYLFSVNSDDITKIQVNGRLEKDTEINSVDYTNLTEENKDAVDNVRFKLTENILQAIYNDAPVITIAQDSENITRNQAIKLDDYNLLDGISVSDDKDSLTVENIDIKLPTDVDILTEDLTKAKELIGQTVTITYQIADNWGRLSQPVTRELTIQSAMNDINIEFLHAATGLVADKNKVSISISVDIENGRLNMTAGNNSKFKYHDTIQYGSFAILDKDNNIKFASILGGSNTYDTKDPIFANTTNITNYVSTFMTLINNKTTELENNGEKLIEYGDKIAFRMAQSPFLIIDGEVIDNQEDYSQGASIAGILKNSTFEITPAGLKQVYTGPTMSADGFSQLTFYNIIAGSQAVNMYLDTTDPNNLLLKAEGLDTEWIDTLNYGNVFRIEVRNADGSFLKGANHAGRTKPNDLANKYNNTVVQNGGYLTLKWFDSSKIKNSKLYNIPRMEDFTEDIDYSREITDETYFNDVRFYFTTDGIVPTYNSAPTFEGIENTSISVGDSFNENEGVIVHDDHDGDTLTYTVSGTVNTDEVGTYTLTYTATDSWSRVGTYTRTVYVKPKIHENHFEVLTKDNNKSFSIDFEPDLAENSSNGTIKITPYSDESLDIDRPTDEIFKVWVYRADSSIKQQVTLLGRDTSSSQKLNVLQDLVYENGDYIKVWRAPEMDATDESISGLNIIGDINGDEVNFKDPVDGIEYMYNTVFYIKASGLEAYHNEAPILSGVKDKVLYYGDDNYNLLEGVSSTNGKGDEELQVIVTPNNIATNKLGTTEVIYSATDSWGRTTAQIANVKVISKSYLNYFEIDGNSKMYIGFNSDINAFTIYNSSGNTSVDELDLSTITSDLNIILYSRFGVEKLNIQFLPTDTLEDKREKLNQLTSINVEMFDMIQISSSDYYNVKVKGDIVNASGNYESGFNSYEDMINVRFQITNGGLAEVHKVASDQVIFNGLSSLTIKRGDDIDLLDGVTVTHPNEIVNNITVSDFDNLKAGTQTVTYSVMDSWGTTFTAERTIEVLPFNNLEKVEIAVSDTDDTELIKVKFDAIESTLSYEINDDTSSLLSMLKKALLFSTELSDDTVVLKVSTFNTDMSEMD